MKMKVMMQGFYWNCMKDVKGSWYQTISNKLPELKRVGVDIIWLPPPTRGMDEEGMGYDIKKHYNLNSAFGNHKELKQLVNKIKNYNIIPAVDVVMGHMIGGRRQYNPNYEDLKNKKPYSYTYFPEEKFPKNYKHFCHKCGECSKMESEFGEKICYYADDGYMKDGFIKWGKWLKKEIGFEGFRLDYVKNIDWDFIKEWTSQVKPAFTVGEYWSGNQQEISDWISYTGNKAFNFPLFYALKEMCNSPDDFNMETLEQYKMKNTVSFVDNHDTDRKEPIIYDKKLAYAYILLFSQIPCIFWKDYYNYNLKSYIDYLLKIRKEVTQPFTVKHAQYDLLVGESSGYRIYINKGRKVCEYKGLEVPPSDYILESDKVGRGKPISNSDFQEWVR